MRTHARGIISYAGLDKAQLWAGAKRAFAQAEGQPPSRFAALLPLFPAELVQSMRYGKPEGRPAGLLSLSGFSIDPGEYHRQLYAEMPELYGEDNRRRNFDYEGRFVGRGVFTVDRTWATFFPQYQPFLGERLVIYPIGGGAQAVAVPESVYPRGCGVLQRAEAELGITARCRHYAAYVEERVAAGARYDPIALESAYLKENELEPVLIRQNELGRVMQELSIVKSLQSEPAAPGLYTENAKRAEPITQYVPYHTACDTFESTLVTRAMARLMQLFFDGGDFTSDLWLPYQEASEYICKQDMTLDVRALCEGFQIPPAYDPETRGGRYPDRVRVAVVRDRELRPLVADTLNNPAYGSGMSPQGLINKLVFLPDSREHLRQGRLMEEEHSLRCENTALSPSEYRRMLNRTALQEHKGALCDMMYRREAALAQLSEENPSYGRARELLDQRVQRLEGVIRAESSEHARAQLSGYDADLDYLRRMGQSRQQPEDGPRPMPFTHDAQRELSVESGYAMRGGVSRFRYEELALPPEPEEEGPEEAVDVQAEDTAQEPTEECVEADHAECAEETNPVQAEAPIADEPADKPQQAAPEAERSECEEYSEADLAESAEETNPAQAEGPIADGPADGPQQAAPEAERADSAERPEAPHPAQAEGPEPQASPPPCAPAGGEDPAPSARAPLSMAQLARQGARPAVSSPGHGGRMAQLLEQTK